MDKIADDTVEQCGEALALREKPCPDDYGEMGVAWKDGVHIHFGYRPFQDSPHQACLGTGTVAKYPMLRKPCPGCQECSDHPHHNHFFGPCLCGGKEWFLVLTEKALWEAVWTIAHHVEVDRETGREGGPIDIWLVLEGQTGDEDDLPWGEGKTVAEALIRALCKAEGIEEVG